MRKGFWEGSGRLIAVAVIAAVLVAGAWGSKRLLENKSSAHEAGWTWDDR